MVAQAWHWSDPPVAAQEIARVLVPGGTLGVVWNIRDHSEPWVAELDRVLHRHSRQEIDTRPDLPAPFTNVERLEVRWEHPLTRSELLDMVASRSYVITMPTDDRAELMNQVGELLDSHLDLRGRKKLTMPSSRHCTRGAVADETLSHQGTSRGFSRVARAGGPRRVEVLRPPAGLRGGCPEF